MTEIILGLLTIICILKWIVWKRRSEFLINTLTDVNKQIVYIKNKIKNRNVTLIDLELATTSQIFRELSKRGQIILLIPHRKNNMAFVETLAAQLSPTQTMDVLRVAYSGIAGHLEEGASDGSGEEEE